MNKERTYHVIEWGTGIGIVAAMMLGWVLGRGGELSFDTFAVFPLLGLIAFGLMWSHYSLGSVRRLMGAKKSKGDIYWSASSGLVLALIILHPALLNYGLIRDGLGLPPASYEQAYGALAPYLTLGMICLIIFLSYELHRWFSATKWWKYIEFAQIAAMIGIFVHALSLGQTLSQPWFMALWWLMGLTLVAAWMYNYYSDHKLKKERGNV